MNLIWLKQGSLLSDWMKASQYLRWLFLCFYLPVDVSGPYLPNLPPDVRYTSNSNSPRPPSSTTQTPNSITQPPSSISQSPSATTQTASSTTQPSANAEPEDSAAHQRKLGIYPPLPYPNPATYCHTWQKHANEDLPYLILIELRDSQGVTHCD